MCMYGSEVAPRTDARCTHGASVRGCTPQSSGLPTILSSTGRSACGPSSCRRIGSPPSLSASASSVSTGMSNHSFPCGRSTFAPVSRHVSNCSRAGRWARRHERCSRSSSSPSKHFGTTTKLRAEQRVALNTSSRLFEGACFESLPILFEEVDLLRQRQWRTVLPAEWLSPWAQHNQCAVEPLCLQKVIAGHRGSDPIA